MFNSIRRFVGILVLMAGVVLAGLTSVMMVSAQEATPEPTPVPDCAECHLDVVAAWQTSLHAQAYQDADFQASWQAHGQKVECLACHTTGFVPRTGEFTHEGVTCEACHGQTPATHPPDVVTIDTSIAVCADCHTTTVNEWQKSMHGEQQLACTTCHLPHPQKLRFETSNGLCLNCHTTALVDYAHVSHPEQNCVDCHWYRSLDETQHVMTGSLLPTGHDSGVETRTCVDCHADLAQQGVTVAVSDGAAHPLLEAEVRMQELQAEVNTVRAQGENNASIQTIQGLLFGALVGGVLMAGFIGVRSRRKR